MNLQKLLKPFLEKAIMGTLPYKRFLCFCNRRKDSKIPLFRCIVNSHRIKNQRTIYKIACRGGNAPFGCCVNFASQSFPFRLPKANDVCRYVPSVAITSHHPENPTQASKRRPFLVWNGLLFEGSWKVRGGLEGRGNLLS